MEINTGVHSFMFTRSLWSHLTKSALGKYFRGGMTISRVPPVNGNRNGLTMARIGVRQ